MKKVVVFSTVGKTGTVIETSAVNWAELQKDLSAKGITHSGMKAVDGASKVTFENPEASIPDEDFNLFLFPVKTKSGAYTQKQADALSFSQLREAIKDAYAQNEEAAKAHFSADKNYTNKSTADLKILVGTYKYPKAKAGKSAPAKETAKAPASTSKAVGKATPAKEVAKAPSKAVGSVAKKGNAADVVKSVANSKATSGSAEDTISQIVSLIGGMEANKTAKDEAIKAVMRLKPVEAGEIDNAALARQAEELSRGFSDIKR